MSEEAKPAEGGEEKADGAAEGGGEGGGGGEAAAEEEIECQLEKTKAVSREQFFELAHMEQEVRGTTTHEQMHWKKPRRWEVRIWDLEVENVTNPPENISIFLNFIFGGTRQEYLVSGPESTSPEVWVAGEEGVTIRSEVIKDDPTDDVSTPTEFDEVFEWRGSYLDLEEQSLLIESWNWARFGINRLDSNVTTPLLQYAKGPIRNEVSTVRTDKFGYETPRIKIAFRIYFQEIYDFELDFRQWRANSGLTCKGAVEELAAKENEEEGGGKDKRKSRMSRISQVTSATVETVAEVATSFWARCFQRAQAAAQKVMAPPNSKKLILDTPANPKHACTQKVLHAKFVATEAGANEWDFDHTSAFRTTGSKVYFRGTVSDFNNASLRAHVVTRETKRALHKSVRHLATTRNGRLELSATSFRLKGVLENASVKADMVPAPWFSEVPGGDHALKLHVGRLEGILHVANHPRYKQLDDANDSIDFESKRYLFVKVVRVDAVVTPGTQKLDEIDTFVNVTFDGEGRRTQLVQNDISPTWNDEIIFELKLSSSIFQKSSSGWFGGQAPQKTDNKQTWEEIERKGAILFDVWMAGTMAQTHLGRCEASLAEILHDERGQSRATETKGAYDGKKKKVVKCSSRVQKGCKNLKFIWGDGSPSNLYFEVWFMRDLSDMAKIHHQIAKWQKPLQLSERRMEKWHETVPDHPIRKFPFRMKSQWVDGPEYFLPRLLDKITPPPAFVNATKLMYYIGSIPYISSKIFDHALTPDFFSMSRSGDTLDHALLHVCYLLGLGKDAYVCLGNTLTKQRHAWAMTLEPDGAVKFWEPFMSLGCAELKHRLAHPEVVINRAATLRTADMNREVRRRKRLLLQQASNMQELYGVRRDQLVLPAEKTPKAHGSTHPHWLAYIDRATGLTDSTVCKSCSRKGNVAEFVCGFKCMEHGCAYEICWECAEPCWEDSSDLEDIHLDYRHPVMFATAEEVMKGDEPLLPYANVDVIFNNNTCYANLQDADPAHMYWDLKNTNYFLCFDDRLRDFGPCFSSLAIFPSLHDEQWCQDLKTELTDTICSEMKGRRIHNNMSTLMVRDSMLIDYLTQGLQLQVELAQSDGEARVQMKQQVSDWKRLLMDKTPPGHRLRARALRCNYGEPEKVAEDVLERCEFIFSRDRRSQFALAVHVVPLPADVLGVYVYVLQLVKLSDFEVEDLRQEIANAGTQEEHDEAVALRKLQHGRMIARAMQQEDAQEAYADVAEVLEELEDVMSGLVATSDLVVVSENGLVATYVGTKTVGEHRSLQGVVIGNGYIPRDDNTGELSFEVKVLRVDTSSTDTEGLAIGLTLTKPGVAPLSEPPPTAADLPHTWAAGFDGAFWDGSCFSDITWKSSSVAPGDVLCVFVTSDGCLTILHNGDPVYSTPNSVCIPTESLLFAVVDLLGTAVEVELVSKGEAPPKKREKKKHTPADGWTTSACDRFDSTTKAGNISVSEDGLLAEFVIDRSNLGEGEEVYDGIVVGSGPITVHESGHAYFEVVMERVRQGEQVGLSIGVTTRHPPGLGPLQGTMDSIDPIWAVGFDGVSFDSRADLWVEMEWQPSSLRVGDRIGCLVSSGGSMHIFVNDTNVADGPSNIPWSRGECLCAVCDLLGGADSIRLVPGAVPPQTALEIAPKAKPSQSLVVSEQVRVGRGRAPIPVMTCFSWEKLSPSMSLSADGLRATLGGDRGLAFGNGGLRQFKEGWYFEVKVVVRGAHMDKGLGIGVTTCSPESLKTLPDTSEDVDPCWLVGFEGVQWDGARRMRDPTRWNPSTLTSGDCVGVLVNTAGDMRVFVNSICVFSKSLGIPTEQPLYAMIDLLGTTAEASLCLEAIPMSNAAYMRSFSLEKNGECVALSPDGLHAVYMGAEDGLNGGLVSDGPLEVTPRGVYFEVRIDKICGGVQAGLAIGVTSTSVKSLPALPETMSQLQNVWLVLLPHSHDLCEGDRVGLLVADTGDTIVYVNGKQRIEGPRIPSCEWPLFALVDLLGSIDGVTFLPKARSPSETQPEMPIQKAELSASRGFCRSRMGAHVAISADGLSGFRSAKMDPSQLGGVLMGALPLPRIQGFGFYYEIQIRRVQTTSQPDGIAVGITSQSPNEVSLLPDSAEKLSPSWLIGFDGATWDSSRAAWGASDWDTRTLAVGDVVGVVVDASGQLCVFINGELCCGRVDWPRGIPVDGKDSLYPLVDLLGHVSCVSLRTSNLKPPSLSKHAAALRRPPDVILPMRGFDHIIHGSGVTVAKDGLLASRNPSLFNAVVFGDGPLEEDAAGGVGFELRVEKGTARSGSSEEAHGLALGFTTTAPWDLRACPDSADKVEMSWLAGFDGAVWDGATSQWSCCDWKPDVLQVGDCIRVRASAAAELFITVNGLILVRHRMRLPAGSRLFALVDLAGGPLVVSLVKTRAAADIASSLVSSSPPLLSGFYANCRGGRIKLREPCLAEYTLGGGGDESGVVLGNGCLHPHEKGGLFYSLKVRAVRAGAKGDFALGVSTTPPGRLGRCPDSTEFVDPSWLVGFDGATWNGVAKAWGLSEFSGQNLRVGDALTVRVTDAGDLVVQVNGAVRVTHSCGIPANEPLFAVIDLSGTVSAAEICPTLVAASAAQLALVSASAEHCDGGYKGFALESKGKAVKLEAGRVTARCEDAACNGVVLSDGSLRPYDKLQNAVHAKFKVVAMRGSVAEDGFSVGVTTRPPASLASVGVPARADELCPSWIVGMDGAFWDGFTQQWALSDFKAADLRVGDVVWLVVALEFDKSDLIVMVNGIPKAKHPLQGLAIGTRLYAIVDLVGTVSAISLVVSDPAPKPKSKAKAKAKTKAKSHR